jgi:DNA (cytosine-5)-methyltransferase 1
VSKCRVGKFKAIDLFAGSGGLSTGLEAAGFEIVFANELDSNYALSLRENHPKTEILVGDIRSVQVEKVRRQLELGVGELDLLAGGPPCQGFSVNAPVRSAEDERNHLFRNYLQFVGVFKPKFVLIENVPGMVSFSKGATIVAILESLRDLGYSVDVRILFAPNFGVPQIRWRTIFLATRLDINPSALFPVPEYSASGNSNFTSKLHGASLKLEPEYITANAFRPCISVWDAIGDLPQIVNGGGADSVEYEFDAKTEYQKLLRKDSEKLRNHRCSKLGPVNIQRLPHIPEGGSWRDIPHELLPKGMQRARRSDHTKRYGRLDKKGLASTILTKCDPHWGAYIHPTQDRVISVREAARLQSFPDTCVFHGSLTEQYAQVGNAVPPKFAQAIGEQIIECLVRDLDGLPATNGLAGRSIQQKLLF